MLMKKQAEAFPLSWLMVLADKLAYIGAAEHCPSQRREKRGIRSPALPAQSEGRWKMKQTQGRVVGK